MRTTDKTERGRATRTPPITEDQLPLANGADVDPPLQEETVLPFPQPTDERHPPERTDEEILDEMAALERDTILTDEDEPLEHGSEIVRIEVTDRLPQFAHFRTNPLTVFKMHGCTDEGGRGGLDKGIVVVRKSFRAKLEADGEVNLREIQFYETYTNDGVIRLIYTTLPEKDANKPNAWLVTKRNALDAAMHQWVTMRSSIKQGQYTYRPSYANFGEPKFTGMTMMQIVAEVLRKQGYLIEDETHRFYRAAANLPELPPST
jgi:hypothetical protein